MKKTTVIMIIMGVLLIGILLMAQTLPLDSRRKVMQFTSDPYFLKVAPADTTLTTVYVPQGAIEMTIVPSGDMQISKEKDYKRGGKADNIITLYSKVPLTIPVMSLDSLYVRRAAAATAVTANIVFKR